MSFWDHLEALRMVLLRVAAAVAVLAIGAFVAMPWVFDNVIMAPTHGNFVIYRLFNDIACYCGFADLATSPDFTVDIVSLELSSQLFIHLSSAAWTAFLIGFPIIVYLLWGFISPGLHAHERRAATSAFFAGNLMFYIGVAVGYFLVFPLALRFLADYRLSETIRPIVSLDSYIDNFFTLLVMMGAVFELPLVAWLLGRLGVLTRSFFVNYRRHAVVVLLIISALITPTGDPFTLFLVFLPVYSLWEAASLLVPKDTLE